MTHSMNSNDSSAWDVWVGADSPREYTREEITAYMAAPPEGQPTPGDVDAVVAYWERSRTMSSKQSVRDIVASYPEDTRWNDGAQTWTWHEVVGSTDADWDAPAVEHNGGICRLKGDGYAESVPTLRMEPTNGAGR